MPTAIDALFETSLTLRLISAKNAALVLGFLQEVFKARNQHSVAEEDLELALDRHLADHVVLEGESVSENRAKLYLNLWCSDGYRYLKKVLSEEKQCYVYQLTKHSEKVLQWMRELETGERLAHTTTESRFSRIFNELLVLSKQTKEDPQARLRDLLAQRDALDEEIREIRTTGRVKTLDSTQVKDRLIDLEQMVSSFLSDFRSIEDRFKEQSAELQEFYLERGHSKGDVVEHALNADEALRNSEQGRSYYGFREAIRSLESREALDAALEDVSRLALQADLDQGVFDTLKERLLLQVTIVQDSYNRIASQLRRVVEESHAQDTHLILDWIAEIKQQALARRDISLSDGEDKVFIQIDEGLAWANLMEMGFFERRESGRFGIVPTSGGNDDSDDVRVALSKLGKPLDLARYRQNVAALLSDRDQVSLRELIQSFPPQDGAVDLVGYLCVAAEDERHLIDERALDEIDLNRPLQPRFATLNRLIFQRK